VGFIVGCLQVLIKGCCQGRHRYYDTDLPPDRILTEALGQDALMHSVPDALMWALPLDYA
jgi:hypothetical protein